MEGDGVSEELDFVCIVLPIGIAYWPLLFPCGRTGPCCSLVEEQVPIGWRAEACILRGSFSEIELPLSYNAHSGECADSINWLRDQPFEQGMIRIYIYICWK